MQIQTVIFYHPGTLNQILSSLDRLPSAMSDLLDFPNKGERMEGKVHSQSSTPGQNWQDHLADWRWGEGSGWNRPKLRSNHRLLHWILWQSCSDLKHDVRVLSIWYDIHKIIRFLQIIPQLTLLLSERRLGSQLSTSSKFQRARRTSCFPSAPAIAVLMMTWIPNPNVEGLAGTVHSWNSNGFMTTIVYTISLFFSHCDHHDRKETRSVQPPDILLQHYWKAFIVVQVFHLRNSDSLLSFDGSFVSFHPVPTPSLFLLTEPLGRVHVCIQGDSDNFIELAGSCRTSWLEVLANPVCSWVHLRRGYAHTSTENRNSRVINQASKSE